VEWRHPDFGFLRKYFKTKAEADAFAAHLGKHGTTTKQYKRKRK
jgi:hypothetical protein